MGQGNGQAELWWRACHFVLDQAGRARLHDTRAALNSVALGLEVIRYDRQRQDSAPGAERVLDVMRRDLLAASDELMGLQSLIGHVVGDELTRLGACLEWIASVAGPVAHRCGVDLEWPDANTVGNVTVHPRLALAVALALMEATLSSPRGGRGIVRYDAHAPALLADWTVQPDAPANSALAPQVLALVPGARPHWTGEGERRQLRIDLSRNV
jgi:hypothetical protein